jgi:hypothetical protein
MKITRKCAALTATHLLSALSAALGVVAWYELRDLARTESEQLQYARGFDRLVRAGAESDPVAFKYRYSIESNNGAAVRILTIGSGPKARVLMVCSDNDVVAGAVESDGDSGASWIVVDRSRMIDWSRKFLEQ